MDRRSPRKILIIGDGMTDMYVHGHMEESQDGCQKFVQESEYIVPGGAGNAKRSLQHWKADVKCVYEATCKSSSPMKVRFLVDNNIVYRWDNDHCTIDFDLVRAQTALTLQNWQPDAVLISDYDKGFLTPNFIQTIISNCKIFNIPCVADVKREPSIYNGAIIKCNTEYASKFGFAPPEGNCGDIPRPFIITNGQYAPVLVEANKGAYWICRRDTRPMLKCVNHVGAGDCFAAHLTLALAYGFSLKESAGIAHSAGRVYVQQPHNYPPKQIQILLDMEEGQESSLVSTDTSTP